MLVVHVQLCIIHCIHSHNVAYFFYFLV